jgi:hypothetical protein
MSIEIEAPLISEPSTSKDDLQKRRLAEQDDGQPKSLWNYGKCLFVENKLLAGFIIVFTTFVLAAGVTKFVVECWGGPEWAKHYASHPWFVATWLDGTTAIDLLCAWLGLFVGVIITLVVERAADKKDSRMREATGRIDDATKKIDGAVTLLNRALNLRAVSDYGTLLTEIDGIITHAREHSNNLFIMNPTASFGYFVTFDADVVLKHEGRISSRDERKSVLSQIKGAEYIHYRDKLVRRHKAIQSDLLSAATAIHLRPGCQVRYVTLRPDGNKSPYSEQFARPALTDLPEIDRRIVIADMAKRSNEAMALTAADLDSKKLFVVPEHLLKSDKSLEAAGGPLDKLVVHLNNDQRTKIEKLLGHTIDVICLDHVPVQLFISWDGEGRECKSLVIFSNRYTIGETSDLAAFVTIDQSVVETFVKMFDAIVRQETEKQTAGAESPDGKA